MPAAPVPVWRTALSGAQILFVAFGATVLVPLLTGLNPSLALLGAGIGTLVFQVCTKRQVPIYLGSSFAFIAPIVEHVGGILAIGSVVGQDYTEQPGLHRTLLGDGLAVNIVGLFGGSPVTTYGEVTGALMLTRNYNPVVMTWAACFAILMAFVGKFSALLQSIPLPVMGGIMVLLFGSIAGIGLKTIMDGKVDLMHPRNLCLISVTLVTGIGGLGVTIGSFSLQGISLCGVLAVLLNQLLPQAQVDPAGAKSTGEGLK
ncbi:MAG: hypothetical protein HIU83_15510 [Proteobacteria bacterium]|nr:hypothetical protein [Pseudomonadota bacterium]